MSLAAGVALLSAGALLGTADVATDGNTFYGIAALITSVSGLIGVLVSAWVALRRKDAATDKLVEALEKLGKADPPP